MRELVVGLASGTDPCNMSHTRHTHQGRVRTGPGNPGKSWNFTLA